MNYAAYRYLWPPRPETKIPVDGLGFYERRDWWAQVKKNGTSTVIFSHGEEVIFKTRHNDDHKAWTPLAAHRAFFAGRTDWNVYVAELLHSKGVGVKNHLYLHDILVSDGVELTGMTFAERQALLAERFPGDQDCAVGAIKVGEHFSRARCFQGDFSGLWSRLAAQDEGLVIKNPVAQLLPCVTQTANAAWQVKSRRASNVCSF